MARASSARPMSRSNQWVEIDKAVVANLGAVREGTIPLREALQDIDRKVTTLVAKR